MFERSNIFLVLTALLIVLVGYQSYQISTLKEQMQAQNVSLPDQPVLAEDIKETSNPLKKLQKQDWDPFKEMQRMQRDMERSFGSFNSYFANDPFFNSAFKNFPNLPLSDIQDRGDHYKIKMNIPGTDKQQIKIEISDDYRLHVSAGSEVSKEENQSSYLKRERYVNRFERTLSLPMDSDLSRYKEHYENGVLSIRIDKK